MNVHKDNCVLVPMNSPVMCSDKIAHTILFFDKNIKNKLLFNSDYYNRAIKSADWHETNHGVVVVNFEDGSLLEFDANKPLSVRK